jgi:Raf kinase inhibitor-like YbhB/YbcL family protein
MHSSRAASSTHLVMALVLAASGACSSSSSSPSDGSGGGAGGQTGDGSAADSPSSIALTSSAFAEGDTIPDPNTCAGANTSPDLTWTAGPAGTMSYAVVLTDLSTSNPILVHWVIWDIPAATHALPAALPTANTLTTPVAAKQVHFMYAPAGMGGYFGPCPSGATHMYQFQVHAIDSATLPDATTAWTTADVKAAVLAHALAHGTLDGMSNATAPATDGGTQ